MSRRGENIRKRKDGRWEGRYRAYDGASGTYHPRSVYARTYTEVKAKLADAKLQNQKKESLPIVPAQQENGEVTFGNAAAFWLRDISASKKHSTYVKYSSIYRKYLKSSLAEIPLNEITSDQIKGLFSSNGQISGSLYKSIYCVINQVFGYAEENFHITALKVPHKKSRPSIKPVEILNRAEQVQLLRFLYEDMDIYKLGVVLCMSTGLRLGEVCALKWSDIDLEEKLLYINRTVQRIAADGYTTKTVLMESEPKSIFSKREIPLSDGLLALLQSFCKTKGYVVSGDRPAEPRTYQKRFQRYLEQAGIKKTNFHILRHTFATNCIDAGTDVKSLSEILGHANVNITLDRYVHPNIDTKRQHLNSLSAIYGQYVGQGCC